MSGKTTLRSSTAIKSKPSGQQTTVVKKQHSVQPSNAQDKANSRVPSRVTVPLNNTAKPKDNDSKQRQQEISIRKVPSTSTKVINNQMKMQSPSKPTVISRSPAKVISPTTKTNTTKFNVQKDTAKPTIERRMSRVETKTATKLRSTLTKSVINQSDSSVKLNRNSVTSKETVKLTIKRSFEPNRTAELTLERVKSEAIRPATAKITRKGASSLISKQNADQLITISSEEPIKQEDNQRDNPEPKEPSKVAVEDDTSVTDEEEEDITEADYSDDFEDYESDFEEYESEDEASTKFENNSPPIDVNKEKEKNLTTTTIMEASYLNNEPSSLTISQESSPRIKWEITLPPPTMRFENDGVDNLGSSEKSSQKEKPIPKDNTTDALQVLNNLLGFRNVNQIGVQTFERLEASSQSDEINVTSKGIQCPTRSDTTSTHDQGSILGENNNIDILRMTHFLSIGEKITKNLIVSSIALNRNREKSNTIRLDAGLIVNKSGIPKNDNFLVLYQPPKDYKTFYLKSLVTDGHYVYAVTSYGLDEGLYSGSGGSVILIWSLLEPRICEYLLFCQFSLTQVVTDNQFLVIAGSIDGSLIVWDLREPSHYHKQMTKPDLFSNTNQDHLTRNPSFTTAVGKHSDYHRGRIQQLFYRSEINDDTETGRIISFDELGKIIVWLIVESYVDDISFQQALTDGLRPGSCVRLQIAMTLNLSSSLSIGSETTTITCIDCLPTDSWNYLIGTNFGSILRYSKFLENSSLESSNMEICKYTYLSDEIYHPATCVLHHPNPESELFLAGYMDGSVCLFSLKYEFPNRILLPEDTGCSTIIDSLWLSMDSDLFLILDQTKGISIRDSKGGKQSLFEHQNGNDRILFVVKSNVNLDKHFLVYGLEDSSILGFNLSNQIFND